jgi:hypothetical protein
VLEKLDDIENVIVNKNVSRKFYFGELPTKTRLVLYFLIVLLKINFIQGEISFERFS